MTSTSIDDIAASAGIAKGSIYYNFDSKAGLVEAIMARSREQLVTRLAEASDGRTGADRQASVVRALLAMVAEHTASVRVMVSELFREERSWAESIKAWRDTALAPLADDLVASGADPAEASLRAAAVVGASLTAGLEWLVFHPERTHAEVASAVLAALSR
ncbi:MAG: TetR/AcrR family transcriptional regulator [Propionicimonas sp.]|uniref:TetR/AcrR family transcriptional regulator n=1 Tax=Propionicimonas sp. TaxID=1955623 RepID=UPI003D11B1B4